MNNEPREFLLMKALAFKHRNSVSDLIDSMSDEETRNLPVKNVCAKIAIPLYDSIESACGILSITKTKFIEEAIILYLNEFDEIVDDFDVFGDAIPDNDPRITQ